MAHKSRYCLDIFLCLHFVNNYFFVSFDITLLCYRSFLCYHYMWISPRMLYMYVDMHLYSSFFLHLWIWTVVIWMQPGGLKVKSFNGRCQKEGDVNSWRYVSIGVFVFSSSELLQKTQMKSRHHKYSVRTTWFYFLHMYEIMDVSEQLCGRQTRHDDTKHSFGSTPPPTSSSHWSELTAAAMQGKQGVFFWGGGPEEKKGLTLLFTSPVKYYRSFM